MKNAGDKIIAPAIFLEDTYTRVRDFHDGENAYWFIFNEANRFSSNSERIMFCNWGSFKELNRKVYD